MDRYRWCLQIRRVALSCVLLAAALLVSCQMRELTRVTPQAFPQPQSCAHCHVEIYNEWQQSPHALAYVSETYRRATDDHRFDECVSCHAPQPRLTASEPQARTVNREVGVACVSCHLDGDAMVGPNQPTGFAKPHPIKVNSALFEDGELCGRCHQSTVSQWRASSVEHKRDCRQCHMPEVRRTMTQATSLISRPIVAAESPGVEHRHVFSLIPTELRGKPIELTTQAHSGELTIKLKNLLPHNLPTGDFGVRLIEVMVRSIDFSGQDSLLAHWEITGSVGASIPSGESRQWRVALPSSARQLKCEVFRRGREPLDQALLVTTEVMLP